MTDDGQGVIPNKTRTELRVAPAAQWIAPSSGSVLRGSLFALLLAACGGGESADGSDGGQSSAQTSDPARDAGREPTSTGDVDAVPTNDDVAAPSNDDGESLDADDVAVPSSDDGELGSGDSATLADDAEGAGSAPDSSTAGSVVADAGSALVDDSAGSGDELEPPAVGSDAATSDSSDVGTSDAPMVEPPVIGDAEPRFEATALMEFLEDGASYDFASVALGAPSPDRKLVIVTHSASNDLVTYDRVLVGGVAAAKVASVGEDVEPSAPTAFFALPFPDDYEADIRVELSTTVVRAAIAVYATYGLESIEPYDVANVTSMLPATLSLDASKPGIVLAGLAMAGDESATAYISNLDPVYNQVMLEGTPTLMAGGARVVSSGGIQLDIEATVTDYNFRAVAAIFQ